MKENRIAQSTVERVKQKLRTALASKKSTKCSCIRRILCCRAKAEEARAERERSTQNANIVIPANCKKQKPSLMRKQKPKTRELQREKPISLQNEAEAKGLYEI
jgi:flotillin